MTATILRCCMPACLVLLTFIICCDSFVMQRNQRGPSFAIVRPTALAGRYYDDFGSDLGKDKDDDDDEDEDDEDEDEDEYSDFDDKSVSDFRSKMGSMFGDLGNSGDDDDDGAPSATQEQLRKLSEQGDSSSVDELIRLARLSKGAEDTKSTGVSTVPSTDWATPASKIAPGVVLVANPAKFCTDFGSSRGLGDLFAPRPSPDLLTKFGLTLPPPADLGADRRADLMPVLLIVSVDRSTNTARGVLLNRRTGYLLGDLEQKGFSDPPGEGKQPAPQPILEKFCIQPLWFGGVDSASAGLDMLHQCVAVPDATRLTDDGLYWGGDPSQAQEAMEDPSLDRVYTGFDFKFFVQNTLWSSDELEQQVKEDKNRVWFMANVSKEVLFKSRDRMGTRRAKPLWTEIMELLGGEFREVRDELYKDELDQ